MWSTGCRAVLTLGVRTESLDLLHCLEGLRRLHGERDQLRRLKAHHPHGTDLQRRKRVSVAPAAAAQLLGRDAGAGGHAGLMHAQHGAPRVLAAR